MCSDQTGRQVYQSLTKRHDERHGGALCEQSASERRLQARVTRKAAKKCERNSDSPTTKTCARSQRRARVVESRWRSLIHPLRTLPISLCGCPSSSLNIAKKNATGQKTSASSFQAACTLCSHTMGRTQVPNLWEQSRISRYPQTAMVDSQAITSVLCATQSFDRISETWGSCRETFLHTFGSHIPYKGLHSRTKS